VVECTYVDSNVTEVPFFATKVKISTEGGWRNAACSADVWLLAASDSASRLQARPDMCLPVLLHLIFAAAVAAFQRACMHLACAVVTNVTHSAG
jgi:hypothetical protein